MAAHSDHSVAKIESAGIKFTHWNVNPRGKSLWGELVAIFSLIKIIRTERPDFLHAITIKPVLYGGVLSRVFGVPSCVFAVSGLGAVFSGNTFTGRLIRSSIRRLYRTSISHPNSCVIFQNSSDRDNLKKLVQLDTVNSTIIRGSGVDLSQYLVVPEPDGVPIVTLAARLLKDKGIVEFLDAADELSARGIEAVFQVAGDMAGAGNPMAFSENEINALKSRNSVKFLGFVHDIPRLFAESSLVVLPSYREGLPKVLIEAGAAGRAVVTTDVPGCRDAIESDVSGLLVPARDAMALANAMETLILDREQRRKMGTAGRLIVENHMKIELICDAHMRVYEELYLACQ